MVDSSEGMTGCRNNYTRIETSNVVVNQVIKFTQESTSIGLNQCNIGKTVAIKICGSQIQRLSLGCDVMPCIRIASTLNKHGNSGIRKRNKIHKSILVYIAQAEVISENS